MTVLVNEKPTNLPDTCDLAYLLNEIGVEGQNGVAVALNGTIVPTANWSATQLSSNDQVLVVQATQGG